MDHLLSVLKKINKLKQMAALKKSILGLLNKFPRLISEKEYTKAGATYEFDQFHVLLSSPFFGMYLNRGKMYKSIRQSVKQKDVDNFQSSSSFSSFFGFVLKLNFD